MFSNALNAAISLDLVNAGSITSSIYPFSLAIYGLAISSLYFVDNSFFNLSGSSDSSNCFSSLAD